VTCAQAWRHTCAAGIVAKFDDVGGDELTLSQVQQAAEVVPEIEPDDFARATLNKAPIFGVQ
jgi:hypothetical protein